MTRSSVIGVAVRRGLPGGLSLLAVLPGRVAAHRVTATRFAAPVPLEYLLLGAGATVALTAVLLARRGAVPRGQRRVATLPAPLVRGAVPALRLGAILVLGAILLDGLFGPRATAENAATLVVWPLWIEGLALVSMLVGSPWPVLSPWRAAYAGLNRLEGEPIALRSYPARLGHWPALLGFLGLLGVVAVLSTVPRDPRFTAAVVASYGLAMVGGALLVGPEWFDHADPLEVLYRLLGRVAQVSIERIDDGVTITLRPPWQGCLDPVPDGTMVAVVLASVYTLSFDGFASTPEYWTLVESGQTLIGAGAPIVLGYYLAGFGLFLGGFLAAMALVGRVADLQGAATAFAPTIIPITAAYALAHNLPYVLTIAGRLPTLLGRGAVDPLWWLAPRAYWAVQVALIVLGHVVAVVAAHGVATGAVERRRRALLAHAPLVALMVAYTVLSLWIVSRPVVA